MSIVLQDVWLPEVKAEYRALLQLLDRDVGCDVGDQLSQFLALLVDWDEKAWEASGPVGSAFLYGLYGKYATMFFAVGHPKAAVVKWMRTGTEHQLSLGRKEAMQRALRLFP